MSKIMINKEAAEEQFAVICDDLYIDPASFETEDDDKDSKKKIIQAIMTGHLKYEDGSFFLTLKMPIMVGENEIKDIAINEPTASDLREMDKVKGKNADVAKGIAVLGAITKLGSARS